MLLFLDMKGCDRVYRQHVQPLYNKYLDNFDSKKICLVLPKKIICQKLPLNPMNVMNEVNLILRLFVFNTISLSALSSTNLNMQAQIRNFSTSASYLQSYGIGIMYCFSFSIPCNQSSSLPLLSFSLLHCNSDSYHPDQCRSALSVLSIYPLPALAIAEKGWSGGLEKETALQIGGEVNCILRQRHSCMDKNQHQTNHSWC